MCLGLQLSSNTMTDTVGGWKIIVSKCATIGGGLTCDVTVSSSQV